jgi:hypothetical protein
MSLALPTVIPALAPSAPPTVEFDVGRGEEVLATALIASERRTHFYSEVHQDNGDAPQRRHIPDKMRRGSSAHLRWLFLTVLTDRRQISEEVYKNHSVLHGEYPWLYEERFLRDWKRFRKQTKATLVEPPKTIELFDDLQLEPEMTPDRELIDFVTLILQWQGVGVPRQSAKYWIPCMRTLYCDLAGDPLRLYESGNIDAILKWCEARKRETGRDPLPGYGPKLLSLLAIFLEELGLLPQVEGAFPVDVHIQRIFISTGAIKGRGAISSDELAEKIRRPLYSLCVKNGWSPLRASHALWFQGNKNCSSCSKRKDIEQRCPLYSKCGGAIESRSYFLEGKWYLDEPRLPKGNPNLVLFPA